MNTDMNTRVRDLTVGELLALISPKEEPKECADYTDGRYVYGISGIATLLGVSKTMVWKYRQAGWIEPALKQRGRKVICDARMALELFATNKPKLCTHKTNRKPAMAS
jgi:hypothetical protein